jgi:prepilin-type processing-associated H-X9-DG protein
MPCGYGTNPANYANSFGLGWAGEIMPYVKSTQLFKCPDDSTSGVTGNAAATSPLANPTTYPVSYAMNCWLAGGNPGGKLAAENAPASTVMLFEVAGDAAGIGSPATDDDSATGDGGDGSGIGWLDATPQNSVSAGCSAVTYATGYLGNPVRTTSETCMKPLTGQHTNGSNFAMADGHVKWLRGASVSPGSTAQSATNGQDVPSMGSAAGTGASGFAATFSPT